MRTPNASPRRRTPPASFLAPLLLVTLALSPAATAQQPGAVELGQDEARLELTVDLDTAWELLLRALEPVAYGELLQRPDDGWLTVQDTYVTAEPMPWLDGTWTRLRARVGGFATELERARAESLLNTVLALWSERQAQAATWAGYRPSSGGTVVSTQSQTTVVVTSPAYKSIYYAPAWCSPMLWYGPTWWSSCYTAWGYYPASYVAFGYTWDDWHIGAGWSGYHGLASCGHYHSYGYSCHGKSYAYGYGYYGYYDPWWHHGNNYYFFDCDDGCGGCVKCEDDDGKDGKGQGDVDGPTRDRDRPRDAPGVARRLTDVADGTLDAGLASRGSSGRSSTGRTPTSRTPGTLTISTGGVTRTITTTGGRSTTLPSLTRTATVARTSGRVYGPSTDGARATVPVSTTITPGVSTSFGGSSRTYTVPTSGPSVSTVGRSFGSVPRSSPGSFGSSPTIRSSSPAVRPSTPTLRSAPSTPRPTSIARPPSSFSTRPSVSSGSSRGSSSSGTISRGRSSSGRGRR